MFEQNTDGTAKKVLAVEDILGPIGSSETVNPNTGLAGKEKTSNNTRVLTKEELEQSNVPNNIGSSPIVFPGAIHKYERLLGYGQYHPEISPYKNEMLMHEAQSTGEMIVNFLGQFVGEVGGGLIEGAGYIADLSLGAKLASETQDQFGNIISRIGNSISETSRDLFPIYIDPSKPKFDPGSASWWLTNGISIGSTLSLLIPSGLATRGVGMLLKTFAGIEKLGVVGEGIIQALFSRHAENLMEARGVWDENYNKYIEAGMSKEEATKLASIAASSTYNKQWALLAQDIPQYILLSKLGKTKGGKLSAKETPGKVLDWFGKNRLATTAGKAGAIAFDMAGEAGEEIYQYLVNEQSNLVAEQAAFPDKKINHSMMDVIKKSYDSGDMWTAAVFGAIGAGVMQAGFAGINHKIVQDNVNKQLDTLKRFGISLNQAIKEYDASLNSGDPIKQNQALSTLIASTALRSRLMGTEKYEDQMIDELSKGISDDLAKKWGLEEGTKGRLKEDPEFAKKIKEGRKRVLDLYDRFKKENEKNDKLEDKVKEPAAQILANSQFLLEETEKGIPILQQKVQDAAEKLEDFDKLSESGKELVKLNARKRSLEKILSHFKDKIKDPEKLGLEEKATVENAIEDLNLKITKTDNDIKEVNERRKKEKIVDEDTGKEISAEKNDKNYVLPEDQIDNYISENARLEAAKESANFLKNRMRKIRDGKFYDTIKEELLGEEDEEEESAGNKNKTGEQNKKEKEDVQTDSFEVGDIVSFLDENKKRQFGIIEGIDKNEEDESKDIYTLQLVDEKTRERKADIVSKTAVELFIDEKNDFTIDENISYDHLSNDNTVEDETEEATNFPVSPLSMLSYSDRTSGARNKEFFDLINDPSVKLSAVKFYLSVDRSSKVAIENLKKFVKYLTNEQKPIFNKFISGEQLSEKEIEVLLKITDNNKFNNFIDVVPISVEVFINDKSYKDGLYLHRSNFPDIKLPKSVRLKGKAEIDVYKNKQFIKNRRNRIELLRILFSGKTLYSNGLNRSRGVPRTVETTKKDRNRKLSEVFSDTVKQIQLAICVSGETTPNQSDLRTSKDNVILKSAKSISSTGNVYALLSGDETLNGDPYALKLNRPFISEEHADILFDAFLLVGRAKYDKLNQTKPTAINSYSVKFRKDDDRVSGLNAGEVIDLLVNNGAQMTEPNTTRFKRRYKDPAFAKLMANKRLYLAISKSGAVLVYGNDPVTNKPYTIDLRNSNPEYMLESKRHFMDWITKNKRYAIYLHSKKLKLTLNGAFLSNKAFRIGKDNPITRKQSQTYKDFVIDNGLVLTDVERGENKKVFHSPVIALNIVGNDGNVDFNKVKIKKEGSGTSTTTKNATTAAKPSTKETTEEEKPVDPENKYSKNQEQLDKEKPGKRKRVAATGKRFNTEKKRTIYMWAHSGGGPVSNPGSVISEISSLIEKSITSKKSVNDTLFNIKLYLSNNGIFVGSKGASTNSEIFSYIKDRFAGNTTKTLLDEWNDYEFPANTKNEPILNEDEESGEESTPAMDVEPTTEGIDEDEPTDVPDDIKSLDDLFGGAYKKEAVGGDYEVANIDEEIEWAFEKIGIDKSEWKIREHFSDLLYKGRNHFALYSHSAIIIYRNAERGTVYHEAFHRVSLGYFTKRERERIYRAARKIYNLSTDKYTDHDVEEFLADKFQLYVMSEGKNKPPSSIASFFKDLFDFIKRIFFGKNSLDENDIERLFRKISEGKYRNKTVLKENLENSKNWGYQKVAIGDHSLNLLNTRREVKNLIKSLAFELLEANDVTDLNDAVYIKHQKLIWRLEDLISNLKKIEESDRFSDKEREEALRLRMLYSEILGERDPKTGLYINYNNIIKPQIDNVLLSLGIANKSNNYGSDSYLINEESDEGVVEDGNNAESISKNGGNYFKESYERNKKETALGNIKFLIFSLHETGEAVTDKSGNKKFEFKRDPLTRRGLFVDFNTVWSKTLNSLYYIDNVDDMIEELKRIGSEENYFPFMELADRLEKSSEMIRMQFFVTMRAFKHDFINLSQINTSNNGVKHVINKTAFSEAFFSEVATWNEDFFNDTEIVKAVHTKQGELKLFFNKKFFTRISDFHQALENKIIEYSEVYDGLHDEEKAAYLNEKKLEIISDILSLLRSFNINVDEVTINNIVSSIQGENINHDFDRLYSYVSGDLRLIFSNISRYGEENVNFAQAAENEVAVDRRKMSFFKNKQIIRLAKSYINAHPELMKDTQLGPGKNLYNTFSENCHVTDVINRINNEEGYIEAERSTVNRKHSKILNDLSAKSDDPAEIERVKKLRRKLSIKTFSYLREASSNDEGAGYMDLTEAEEYLLKMAFIFNRDEDGNSDPLLPFPTVPRKTYFLLSGATIFKDTVKGYKNGIFTFSDEVIDYFYGLYEDELERSNEALALIDKYLSSTGEEKEAIKRQLLQNYHYTGNLDITKGNAYSLTYFNGFEVNKGKDVKVQKKLAKQAFRVRFEKVLNNALAKELEYAKSIKILGVDSDTGEYYTNFINRDYLEDNISRFESDNIGIMATISDFMINNMMSFVETEKLFYTDPAFFSIGKNSNDVWEDFHKRLFGIGSSGENYADVTSEDQDPSYNVLTINSSSQKMKSKYYNVLFDIHKILWKKYLNDKSKGKLSEEELEKQATALATSRLSEYLNVDPTDGQAFISPTMYKRMLMRSGLFNDRVKKAFDLLESDKELSVKEEIELLGIVLNPQKTVYVGNHNINDLNVLVYDKMSMAPLFKRVVKGTYLEDLYNRMELNDKYANVEGLEKIHAAIFSSAIKVGGTYGYNYFKDPNIRKDTEDLTGVILQKRYWKNLRKQISTESEEDYSEQLLGTQIYKIASSNIDKTKPYGEFKSGLELLNSLTRSRVAMSNMGLRKVEATLGIVNGRISNSNLIRMLRSDVLKAKKSDDFMRALKVDAVTGKLNLQIDAFPDRRWLYSRLLKLVTRNTIDVFTPGAKLIQVSDWGFNSTSFDDELAFTQLKEGEEFAYKMECRISTRVFKHLIPDYDKLTHEQRVEFLSSLGITVVGYRIPTQGQNSVVVMNIKTFLPDEAGDIIRLPLEFTALTGSDFDIDKLYIFNKNYSIDDTGKVSEIKFDSDTSDAAIKRRYENKIKELYNIFRNDQTVITSDVRESLSKYSSDTKVTDEQAKKELSQLNDEDKILYNDAYAKYEYFFNAWVEEKDKTKKQELYDSMLEYQQQLYDITHHGNVITYLENKALDIKKEALINAGKLVSFEEFKKLSIEEQNLEAANQNRMFDIFQTVILNEKHYLSSSQPLGGVTNQLKRLASEIENASTDKSKLITTGIEVGTPKFQGEAKFRFLSSSKGIGVFALANAHHSLTQQSALKMRTSFKYGIEKNRTVDLDRLFGMDDIYITDWLSAMIDAHVDALKDNYISKLNVNEATYGVTALLLRLGFGIDTFKFIAQPIIKEFAKEFYNYGGRVRTEGDINRTNIYEKLYLKIFDRYKTLLGFSEDEEFNLRESDNYISFSDIIEYYKDRNHLLHDINPENRNDRDVIIRQLNILKHFVDINDDAKELTKLILECRIDTKQIGATPSEQRFNLSRIKELEDSDKFPGLRRLINSDGTYVENGTMLPTLLRNSILAMQKFLSDTTVYNTSGFDDLFWQMSFSIPSSSDIRISTVNNIVEEMFSYFSGEFFGNPEYGIGMTREKLEKLVVNTGTSIFTLLSKMKKENYKYHEELKNNAFFNLLKVDSKTGLPIEFYIRIPFISNSDKFEIDDYIEGFLELYNHEDAEVRSLARMLYLYSYYTTGFRHRFRGYTKYIPASMHKSIKMLGPKKGDTTGKQAFNDVSFNDFIYNLIQELNTPGLALEKYLVDARASILQNNWFNRFFVPDISELGESRVFSNDNGNVIALILDKKIASKYKLGQNDRGSDIFAHFIVSSSSLVSYQYLTDDKAEEVAYNEEELTSLSQTIAKANKTLFEFVGIDVETGNPIYMPVNRKGFYEKGNIFREYGIRDSKSAIRTNNLIHEVTIDEVKAAMEKADIIFDYVPRNEQNISKRSVLQSQDAYQEDMRVSFYEEQNRKEAEKLNKKTETRDENIHVTTLSSGLQTGVDTELLKIAKELGYETMGYTTSNFVDEQGSNESIATELGVAPVSKDSLEEWENDISKLSEDERNRMHDGIKYLPRTWLNVKHSDATLYFSASITESDPKYLAGFYATRKAAKFYNKPFFVYVSKEAIKAGFQYRGYGVVFTNAEDLRNLVKLYNPTSVNLAGSRLSTFTKLGKLDELENMKEMFKTAFRKESPAEIKKNAKVEIAAKNASSFAKISTYDSPIQIYVDGSVEVSKDENGNFNGSYGYGAVAVINGKQYNLSGTKEEVDEEFFKKFPEVKNQSQFSPSMELLGLVSVLKAFKDTGEHLVIRQDNDGSVSYDGLAQRALEDPFGKSGAPWKASAPHIKYLVSEAVSLIEQIEKNGGSVRIFYVPGHGNTAKWNKYINAYEKLSTKKITEDHIKEAKMLNSVADELARNKNKINTISPFVKSVYSSGSGNVSIDRTLESGNSENEEGEENKKNCNLR